MKVLHIAMGSPEIDTAFRQCGHQIARVNWREILGRRFANGSNRELDKAIRRELVRGKPDLVFAQTHQSEVISMDLYDEMRACGAFVVNWCGDVREPFPEVYARIAEHVDVMAFSNMTDVEILRSRGLRSEYLQIGYDPVIYNPGDGTQERSGIVFMANNYPGRFPNSDLREQVAERLKEEFGDDFTLYGFGWGSKARPVSGHQEADIYRRSLVAINVDHFTRPYFASDRILRAQACGCAVVAMEYDGGWKEHPEVDFCESIDDMIDAVQNGLEHPETGGYMNVYNRHRWHNRVKQMEQWVKS